jgi:citrate lyase subunit beta/citryl-CoA lyase
MIQNSDIYGADMVLLDLEDSITYSEKDAARNLVKNALINLELKVGIAVRINPLDSKFALSDLEEIVPVQPDALRIPKVESAQQIVKLDQIIASIEKEEKIKVGSTKIMVMLETAKGILNAEEIACSSKRISALTIGAEDLTADIGTVRSEQGDELFYARSRVALAAAASNISVFDSVYSNINNKKGLIEEAEKSKKLGFTGKAVIHPSQVSPVNKVFSPDLDEIRDAKRIIKAARKAEEQGEGVVKVNGKMVDKPVIKRAERIMKLANSREGELL